MAELSCDRLARLAIASPCQSIGVYRNLGCKLHNFCWRIEMWWDVHVYCIIIKVCITFAHISRTQSSCTLHPLRWWKHVWGQLTSTSYSFLALRAAEKLSWCEANTGNTNPIQSSSDAYHFLAVLLIREMWPHFISLPNFFPGLTSLTTGSAAKIYAGWWHGMAIRTCLFHVLFWHTTHFAKIFEQLCTHNICISNGLSAKDVGMVCHIQILPGKEVHF